MDEALLRETVRAILKESSITSGISMRRVLTTERRMSDWDIVRAYAGVGSHRRHLLTEAQVIRGGILSESLMTGITAALSWVGGKTAGFAGAIKQYGKKAYDLAKKVVIATLDEIKGDNASIGEAIFDMLAGFTEEVASELTNAVGGAFNQFVKYLWSKRDQIYQELLSHARDKGVEEGVKKLFSELSKSDEKAMESLKEVWELLKTNPLKAFVKVQNLRGIAGKILKGITNMVLKAFPQVGNKISNEILGTDMFKGPTGRVLVKLIIVATTDMTDIKIIEAAGSLWKSWKNRNNSGVNTEHMGRLFRDNLSDIIGSLAGGTSGLEGVARTLMGDLKGLGNLIKNAITLAFNYMRKNLDDALSKIFSDNGIAPKSAEAKTIRTVAGMLLGGVGSIAGATAAGSG